MSSQSYFFNPQDDRMSCAGSGLQLPRLSSTQRLALTVGVNDAGLQVFDTTLQATFVWTGATWVPSSGSSGEVITVDNIAALKAQSVVGLPDGQVIMTRGYYTENDGGQGTYVYDSGSVAVDNGGTVIAPAIGTGRFLLFVANVISVKQFGAKGDGVTDDATPIQNAGTYAASANVTLVFPAPSVSYLCNSQLDLRDIQSIQMDTAAVGGIASTVVGSAAVLFGGSSINLGYGDITLFVHRPSFALNWTPGTVGVSCAFLYSTDLKLNVRGFETNVLFNPGTGQQVTYCRIKIAQVSRGNYNIAFQPTGSGYCNQNQISGGVLYLAMNGATAPMGNIRIWTEGTAQVADLLCREIDFAGEVAPFPTAALMFRFVPNGATVGTLGCRAVNCRAEVGTAADVPLVNIEDTSNDRVVECFINITNFGTENFKPVIGDPTKKHYIIVTNDGMETTGVTNRPLLAIPSGNIELYQGPAGTLRTINRKLFRADTGAFVQSFTPTNFSLSGNSVSAYSNSELIVGQTYTKTPGKVSFIRLSDSIDCAVVCYNAAGAVLSGSAPYYALGKTLRTTTIGVTSFYQFLGGWLWLHPDVASFFIGYCPWNSAVGQYRDIQLIQGYGATIERTFTGRFCNTAVVTSGVPASFFSAGQIVGDISGAVRYGNSLDFESTLSVAAIAGDFTVTLVSAAGLANGDVIGVQLDATVTGVKKWHVATVVGAPAGNVVTLSVAIPSNSAIGNSVRANRWTAF